MTRPVLDLDAQSRRPDAATAATVARLLRKVAALLVATADALGGTGRAARRRRGLPTDIGALEAAAHDLDPAAVLNPPGWVPFDPAAFRAPLAGGCNTPATPTVRSLPGVPSRPPGPSPRGR